MIDDPKKLGRDRRFVSTQEHEVVYVMRATNATRQQVLDAIRAAGPEREKVIDYLRGRQDS